jgi:hypothetical protein
MRKWVNGAGPIHFLIYSSPQIQIMQPPEPNRWTLDPELERWLLALSQLAIIGLSAAILVKLRLPIIDDWMPLKQVVVAVASVILAGKCLFDTLFFDRRQP